MKHIFLVNPIAGDSDKSEQIFEEVEDLSRFLDFEHLFFIIEDEGYETEVTEKLCTIYPREKIRIYACGGSGTFQRILDASKKFKNVELACYPCGFTNDFLKCFKNKELFYNLKNLINGTPVTFDAAEFNGKRFCNAICIGATARVIGDIDSYFIFNKKKRNLPYFISTVHDVFYKHSYDFTIDIDGEDYSGNYLLVGAFNGPAYGGTLTPAKNAKPNDKLLDFVLFEGVKKRDTRKAIKAFSTGDTEILGDKMKIIRGKKMKVMQKSGLAMPCNIDGEIYSTQGMSEISIKPDGLRLIVPTGAELLP